VAESTGQGKSKLIRKMFKIRNFDRKWTLPSRMDDNPVVWMLSVNGFLMDIRNAPREAQSFQNSVESLFLAGFRRWC